MARQYSTDGPFALSESPDIACFALM